MQAGFGDDSNLQALGKKADAPVDFAQPLFAVDVVAVFRAVAIARRPVHGVHHLGPLYVDQRQKLVAQGCVTGGRDVVFAACGQGGELQFLIVCIFTFLGEGFAHGRSLLRTQHHGGHGLRLQGAGECLAHLLRSDFLHLLAPGR